jgi:hypothetical protein
MKPFINFSESFFLKSKDRANVYFILNFQKLRHCEDGTSEAIFSTEEPLIKKITTLNVARNAEYKIKLTE